MIIFNWIFFDINWCSSTLCLHLRAYDRITPVTIFSTTARPWVWYCFDEARSGGSWVNNWLSLIKYITIPLIYYFFIHSLLLNWNMNCQCSLIQLHSLKLILVLLTETKLFIQKRQQTSWGAVLKLQSFSFQSGRKLVFRCLPVARKVRVSKVDNSAAEDELQQCATERNNGYMPVCEQIKT